MPSGSGPPEGREHEREGLSHGMDRPRRLRTLLCVLTAAGLAAGCGGGEDEAGPAAAPARPALGPGGPPVAVVEASIEETPIRFVDTELRRTGATVVLNARVALAGRPADDELMLGGVFDDGRIQRLEDGSTEGFPTFDGPSLIDSAGGRRYLVARDANGACPCGRPRAGCLRPAPLAPSGDGGGDGAPAAGGPLPRLQAGGRGSSRPWRPTRGPTAATTLAAGRSTAG